jgi:hypothetical protein
MARRRTQIGGQFAPRLIEMLESHAYRALSLSGHRVLDRIEIEMAHHGGTDNGKLPVTYDDFEHYGIHRHSIAPAIREVVALGFVEITKPGRAGNADFRAPNIFRLTYRDTKREAPTHEWRRVETAEEAAKRVLTARGGRVTRSLKNKTPVVENASPSGGNHHRNHSTETATTGHSAETATTLDISGRLRLQPIPTMDTGPRSAPTGERASGPTALAAATPALLASRLVRGATSG